jgi:sigma-E factor negative regulatory protein RseC
MKDLIQHQGIIERIEKRKIFVRIEQKAACCACRAQSACPAADKKVKVIEIDDHTASRSYARGEQVVVSTHASTGLFAVMTAFGIPLILVVGALVAALNRSGNEAVGALAGLAVLIPYGLILYIFRDRVKKKCIFTLTKLQHTATPPPSPPCNPTY